MVDDVIKELDELKKLRLISAKKQAACLAYIAANRAEVEEMAESMGITAATDLLRDLAR